MALRAPMELDTELRVLGMPCLVTGHWATLMTYPKGVVVHDPAYPQSMLYHM